jgi:CubicO group peptidase (beta-lactamase class C family)
VRLLRRETVAAMTADNLRPMKAKNPNGPGAGYGFGLGFAVRTGEAEIPGSPGDYYWSGWAGTFFWIDPRQRLIGIMMLQAPERGYECWVRMRKAVYGALTS